MSGVCAVFHEPAEGGVPIAALLGPRVELAVRVGAGSALAETVVGLRIHPTFPDEGHEVPTALAHGLSPFEDNGAQPQFNQSQCAEQSSRSSAHDHHFRCALHGLPPSPAGGDGVQPEGHPQLDGGGVFPGIEAAPEHHPVAQLPHLPAERALDGLAVVGEFRQQAQHDLLAGDVLRRG